MALAQGGCSWIFVQPLPPDYQRGDPIACTTSVGAPIADTLLAASNIAGALYVAGTVGSKATPAENALVSTGLVWTVVYISAAVHGYRATAACREAKEEDERPGRRRFPALRPAQPRPTPATEPAEPAVTPERPATPQQMDDDYPGRSLPKAEPPPPLPAQS
jgi:hypothetical protein